MDSTTATLDTLATPDTLELLIAFEHAANIAMMAEKDEDAFEKAVRKMKADEFFANLKKNN